MTLNASHTQHSGEAPLSHRRIVVKAGTNVLTSKSPRLDRAVMASLVAQIAELSKAGAEVVIVTSGAVAAGREALGSRLSGKAVAESQMLAAVGQIRLMHAYQELFAPHDVVVAQALLTRQDVEARVGYLNVRNTLAGLLAQGVVPIVNENDVVDTAEISQERFGDNDTLSALVANLVDADLLLLLTDTGGLYTADPNRDPTATLIPRIDRVDVSILRLAEEHKSTTSRGGMASKLLAAQRATAAGVAVVVAPGGEPNVVLRVANGEAIGTLFPATTTTRESRKRWLLSGTAESGGVLLVDDGAAKAVRSQDRSLLPAGVREVEGAFGRGDVVTVSDAGGEPIAYGIVNYDADDLRAIRGSRSPEFGGLIGHHYGDEAIHRNNMVVL
jgi:glutamate 5-kinase